ncbi:MAG: hypothetical protein A4E53_03232 [Pelotomaculum sp. PtaB.Bin104]|nr:MAG: hypothetical protein A4E53_03232 [Pelotomaculum sp. PtaB.Bin104]
MFIDGALRGGIKIENFCGNFCPKGPQGCCTYTPTYYLFDLAYMLSIGREDFIKEVLLKKLFTARRLYIQVNPRPETGICQFHDFSSGCTLDWVLRSRTCRRAACNHMNEMILDGNVHYQSRNDLELKLKRAFQKFILEETPLFSLKDYLEPSDNNTDEKFEELINYLTEMWDRFPLKESMTHTEPTETFDFIIETKVKQVEETSLYVEYEVEAIKSPTSH